jgi:hypothetical protein
LEGRTVSVHDHPHDELPHLKQARAAAADAELRLVWAQIEAHHVRRLLQFSDIEELVGELAEWAHTIEVLALATREALHAALAKHVEDAATIAKLRRQVHDLTPRRRKRASAPRSSAPADQVAA